MRDVQRLLSLAVLLVFGALPGWAFAQGPAPAGHKPLLQHDTSQATAAELDQEEAARRAAEKARQPTVAPGLRLPDESGVWGLDRYHGTPELVRIPQSDGDLNLDLGHSVKPLAIPTHGAKELIRLMGDRASVTFHTLRPVFYVALEPASDSIAPEDAMVIDTHGAEGAMQDRTQEASPDSSYALVHLRSGNNERVATAQELSALASGGEQDGRAPVVALHRQILQGARWMRLEPRSDVSPGQYSLVEILPGDGENQGFNQGFNQDGWDFGVDPEAPDNPGGRVPTAAGGDSAP